MLIFIFLWGGGERAVTLWWWKVDIEAMVHAEFSLKSMSDVIDNSNSENPHFKTKFSTKELGKKLSMKLSKWVCFGSLCDNTEDNVKGSAFPWLSLTDSMHHCNSHPFCLLKLKTKWVTLFLD